MRTTIYIDDELLTRARRITGILEPERLVLEGLRALVERESSRQLARMGGSQPHLERAPRRRWSAE